MFATVTWQVRILPLTELVLQSVTIVEAVASCQA